MLAIQKFVRPYNLKVFLNIVVCLTYLLWNIFHLLKHLTLNSIIFRKTIGDCFEKRGHFQLNSGQHMIENVSVHLALSTKHILRTLYKLAHFILTEILVLLLLILTTRYTYDSGLSTYLFYQLLIITLPQKNNKGSSRDLERQR